MPINKIYLALVTVLMLQLAAMAEGTNTTEGNTQHIFICTLLYY